MKILGFESSAKAVSYTHLDVYKRQIMFGLIILASSDLGSALVYLFIFVVMLFLGGLQLRWFAAGIALSLIHI